MAAALAGSAALAIATACHASSAPGPVLSACAELGGTVGSDGFCEVRDRTPTYAVNLRFPADYPDQSAVADYLKRTRTDFIDWVGGYPTAARETPFELDVAGRSYRSGDRQTGTRSLVLDIGHDTGVHPVTTYRAFNYSLADHAPVSFESLFESGCDPLRILNPVVRQRVLSRDPAASAAVDDLTAASYQQFAITDDAIVFFFDQDGLLPHEDGPLEVAVPRGLLTC